MTRSTTRPRSPSRERKLRNGRIRSRRLRKEAVLIWQKAEAEVLAVYLPQPLSAEEVEALVKSVIAEVGATSKAQMGAVMKAATERAAGRADGRALSAAVAKLLS